MVDLLLKTLLTCPLFSPRIYTYIKAQAVALSTSTTSQSLDPSVQTLTSSTWTPVLNQGFLLQSQGLVVRMRTPSSAQPGVLASVSGFSSENENSFQWSQLLSRGVLSLELVGHKGALCMWTQALNKGYLFFSGCSQ